MFVVSVVFEAVAGHEDALRAALERQAAASLAEPGCIRFDVAQDVAAPGRFFLYEIYRAAADFDSHLMTPHFLAFDQQVRPLVNSKHVDRWHLVAGGA